jgi:hypothetical protein
LRGHNRSQQGIREPYRTLLGLSDRIPTLNIPLVIVAGLPDTGAPRTGIMLFVYLDGSLRSDNPQKGGIELCARGFYNFSSWLSNLHKLSVGGSRALWL